MADDKQRPYEGDPFRGSSIASKDDGNKNHYHNNNNLDIDTNAKYYSNSNNLKSNTNAKYYSSSTDNSNAGNTNAGNTNAGSTYNTGNLYTAHDFDNTINSEVGYYEDNNNRLEETAAEIAAPVNLGRDRTVQDEKAAAGTGIGVAAIVLSIISLFVMPVLFGAVGIVLGFIARARGSTGLGSWAIGIGIVSIVMAMFIVPLF